MPDDDMNQNNGPSGSSRVTGLLISLFGLGTALLSSYIAETYGYTGIANLGVLLGAIIGFIGFFIMLLSF